MSAATRGRRVNHFAGGALDRAAHRRPDEAFLDAALGDPATRFVPVWRDRSLLRGDGPARAALLGAAELGRNPRREDAVFLGVGADGAAVFALALAGDEAEVRAGLPAACRFADLREEGGALAAHEAALLAHARALVHWHESHRFCARCGAPTRPGQGGHQRECERPGCGARHFPRTDPAVIVLVRAPARGRTPERCLLGRPPAWPAGLHSTVAGFVEPGESLEEAVVREVHEETGVRVARVRYHSSQPWPFPSSLMLGYTAVATTTAIHLRDGELERAAWYSREALVREAGSGSLRLPRRISIAYRLVEDWFDAGSPGRLRAALAGRGDGGRG